MKLTTCEWRQRSIALTCIIWCTCSAADRKLFWVDIDRTERQLKMQTYHLWHYQESEIQHHPILHEEVSLLHWRLDWNWKKYCGQLLWYPWEFVWILKMRMQKHIVLTTCADWNNQLKWNLEWKMKFASLGAKSLKSSQGILMFNHNVPVGILFLPHERQLQ